GSTSRTKVWVSVDLPELMALKHMVLKPSGLTVPQYQALYFLGLRAAGRPVRRRPAPAGGLFGPPTAADGLFQSA
ncbi:hypothetical protein, partial [Streptosporangium sp. NPDC003464]